MDSSLRPIFVHRANRNGTEDSICLQCSVIVGTSVWEDDLDRAEKIHACNPDPLAPWNALMQRDQSILPSCSDTALASYLHSPSPQNDELVVI